MEKEQVEPISEELEKEIENIPTQGEAANNVIMSEQMQREMYAKQQQFFQEVIKVTADKILNGEVSGSIDKSNLPKNMEAFAVDKDPSSWNISIMINILSILQQDEIIDETEACKILDKFLDLYNRNFITWYRWKKEVHTFVNSELKNIKILKKANTSDNKWDNFILWVKYSLINTNLIRETVVQRYFQPAEPIK